MFAVRLLLILGTLAPAAMWAMTTQDLLRSSFLRKEVKSVLSALVEKGLMTYETEWADSAVLVLRSRQFLTEIEAFQVRENSELTNAELMKTGDFPKESRAQQLKRRRPPQTPNQALYVDVYQESPVLIDMENKGNAVRKTSFAVVYKYLQDDRGVVRPRFVRAHLVSPGIKDFETPLGEYTIERRYRYYVSNTYGVRMDYAQFFVEGVALHAALPISHWRLGKPASHGCVRQQEGDAAAMWTLIGNEVKNNHYVNVKVYKPGTRVQLPDGSLGVTNQGVAGQLNDWLNHSAACARGDRAACRTGWVEWYPQLQRLAVDGLVR